MSTELPEGWSVEEGGAAPVSGDTLPDGWTVEEPTKDVAPPLWSAHVNTRRAMDKSPDQVAKSKKVAGAIGWTPALVDAQPQEAQWLYDTPPMDSLSPSVRGYLASSPENAAISKDDARKLDTVALLAQQEKFDQERGPLTQGVDALMRGTSQAVSSHYTAEAVAQQTEIERIRDFAAKLQEAPDEMAAQELSLSYGLMAGDVSALWSAKDSPDDFKKALDALTAPYMAKQTAALDTASIHTAVGKQVPESPLSKAAKEYSLSEVAGAWGKYAGSPLSHPLNTLNALSKPVLVAAEGLPGSAPLLVGGMAGGAVGGPVGAAVGAGMGSFGTNYASKLEEGIQAAGVDTANPDAVRAFLQDREKAQAVVKDAVTFAAAASPFDAATFGLGAKVLAPGAWRVSSKARMNALMQPLVQMAGGALGQASGQIATKGEVYDVKGLAMGAVGQLGFLPFEHLAGTFHNAMEASRAQKFRDGHIGLNEALHESATMKRSPESAREFLAEHVKVGEAFVDAEAAEKKPDLAPALEKVGVKPEEIAKAAVTGEPVKVDMAQAHTALSPEEFKAVADVLTPSPDARSPEAAARLLGDKEELDSTINLYQSLRGEEAAIQKEMGRLREDALKAGRTPEEFDAVALITEAAFKRLAANDVTGATTVSERLASIQRIVGESFSDFEARPFMFDAEAMVNRAKQFYAGTDMGPDQGKSLLTFLIEKGGIKDTGGDVADLESKRPGLLNQNGLSLDQAARQAHEAGYFPEVQQYGMDLGAGEGEVSPDMLVNALRDELAGAPRYAADEATRYAADIAKDDIKRFEAFLGDKGLTLDSPLKDIARALADEHKGKGDLFQSGTPENPEIPVQSITGEEISGGTPKEVRKNANAYIAQLIAELADENGKAVIFNKPTERDIELTAKGARHGFRKPGEANVKAATAMRGLIEEAVEIADSEHDPLTPDVLRVHTYVAPLELRGDWYAVKLTVKKMADGNFKLYDHQALPIEKPGGSTSRAASLDGKLDVGPSPGSTVSLAHLMTGFKGENARYIPERFRDGGKTQFQPSPTTPRGATSFLKNGQTVIRLFETANASTLVHEVSHVFFGEMRTLIDKGAASDALKADWQTLHDWFGVKVGDELTTEHQEKFARGFEEYLAEGKAPTKELEGAFARFKRWLLNIYGTAKALGANLNDDVRGVYDRLLSTSDEVDAFADGYNLTDLTDREAASLGLSDEQRAANAAALRALKDSAKEALQKSKDRQRAELVKGWWDEAAREVKAQRVYALRDHLAQKGEGINSEDLRMQFGEGVAGEINRKRPGAISVEGKPADWYAAMYGYDTVEAMVNDLRTAPSMTEAKAAAFSRLSEAHDAQFHPDGEVFDNQHLDEYLRGMGEAIARKVGITREHKAAMDAATKATGRAVDAMAKVTKQALETQAKEFAASQRGAKAAARSVERENRLTADLLAATAREKILTSSVGDMTDTRALSSAFKKAVENTRREIVKGDFEKARDYNRSARVLYNQLKQSMGIARQVEEFRARATKMVKKQQRGTIAPGYLEHIKEILGRHGIVKTEPTAPEVMPHWSEMAGDVIFDGEETAPAYADWVFDTHDSRAFDELPVAEAFDLMSTVENLAGTGRKLVRMAKGLLPSYEKGLNDIAADLITAAQKITRSRTYVATGDMGKLGAAQKELLNTWRGSRGRNLQALVEVLDGGTTGPWNTYIFDHAMKAHLDHLDIRAEWQKPLADGFFEQFGARLDDKVKTSVPVPPAMRKKYGAWKFEHVLSLAAQMGSEEGRNAVLRGNGLTSMQLLQLFHDAGLSAADWHAIKATGDHLSLMFPRLAEAFQKRTGTVLPRAATAPFTITLPDMTTLTLDGWYSPLHYDAGITDGIRMIVDRHADELIQRGVATQADLEAIHKNQDAAALTLLLSRIGVQSFADAAQRAGVQSEIQIAKDNLNRSLNPQFRSGMTKERTSSGGKAVSLELSRTLDAHTAHVAKYVAYMNPLNDIYRVLTHPGVKQEVTRTQGQEFYEKGMADLPQLLRDMAGNGGAMPGWMSAAYSLKGNVSLAILRGSKTLGPRQLLDGLRYVPEIGYGTYAKGAMAHLAMDGRKFTLGQGAHGFIMEKSRMMRERFAGLSATFADKNIEGRRGPVGKVLGTAGQVYDFVRMTLWDAMVNEPAWLGKYQEVLAATGNEKQAIFEADKLVSKVQPTQGALFKSGFQRDKSGINLAFNWFSSQTNVIGNNNWAASQRWLNGSMGTGEYLHQILVGRIAQQLLWRTMQTGLTYGGVAAAPEEWKTAAKDVLGGIMADWFLSKPGTEQAAQIALRAAQRGRLEITTPWSAPVLALETFWNNIDDLGDRKKPKAFENAMWGLGDVASLTSGVPVAQTIRDGMKIHDQLNRGVVGPIQLLGGPMPEPRRRNRR